jgi:hypothetical protein
VPYYYNHFFSNSIVTFVMYLVSCKALTEQISAVHILVRTFSSTFHIYTGMATTSVLYNANSSWPLHFLKKVRFIIPWSCRNLFSFVSKLLPLIPHRLHGPKIQNFPLDQVGYCILLPETIFTLKFL